MVFNVNNRKYFFILATAVTTTYLIILTRSNYETPEYNVDTIIVTTTNHNEIPPPNWRGLTQNQINNLSVLGRILYLDEKPPKVIDSQKKYQILIWKYGKDIENRHLKQYGNKIMDPFQDCSVNNCEITYKDTALKTADLVIIHLHRMKEKDLPKRSDSKGLWAFLTDESPYHSFLNKNNPEKYSGIFNWSMTYRMDSDIPVPYGRTIAQESKPLPIQNKKKLDVLVAIMGSNCKPKNKRWEYVKELQKHIQVDVYGGCGTLKTCPGHFRKNCQDIDSYLFYLSFENSNCDDYITEKLWWNAYEKQAIPVVMGAPKESCMKLLPPNSYLHVDDYAQPKDLAEYILYLNRSGNYRNLHNWRRHFRVLNEHGYFGSKSYHYCRACQALNYNNRTKVYKDFKAFWSVSRDCHPAWNT